MRRGSRFERSATDDAGTPMEAYEEAIDRIKKVALSLDASAGVLAEVANRMERQR